MLPHRWDTVNVIHIQGLVLGCPWITNVDLRNCSKLGDNAVMMIAETLGPRHLRSLVLSGCARISDVSILSICANVVHLENLEISGCDRITDVSIYELGTATIILSEPLSPAPSTTHILEREESEGSKEEGAGKAVIVKGTSKTLQSLDISFCTRITEASIRALRVGISRLSSLNLEGCYGVLLNEETVVTNEWEDLDDSDFTDDEFDLNMSQLVL
ncbi:hypothetical protein BGZ94_006553 [Podila epigama]|nr:hypothetical protein BGZ94_006553 [Podila epigama]